MLSCVKATTMIEKKYFDELSRRENLRLKLHTSMCNACSQYERQSKMLNHAISLHLHEFPVNGHANKYHLESNARQRMRNIILKNR